MRFLLVVAALVAALLCGSDRHAAPLPACSAGGDAGFAVPMPTGTVGASLDPGFVVRGGASFADAGFATPSPCAAIPPLGGSGGAP